MRYPIGAVLTLLHATAGCGLFAGVPVVFPDSGTTAADAGSDPDGSAGEAGGGGDRARGRDRTTGVDHLTGVDHTGGVDLSPGVDRGGTGDAGTAPDVVEHDAGPPQGTELNPGFIGGACDTSGDCDTPAGQCETDGFVDGMCTEPCTQYCPDAADGYGPGTAFTTSRCIETGTGVSRCVSQCDFDKSPTGCRTGYSCVLRQRAGQPENIYPVCLPWDTQGWPGQASPMFDIGQPCASDQACGHLACLELPGGYCTKTMCEFTSCPAGSSCFGFEGNDDTYCLDDCTAANQCRQGENYTCDTENGICWTEGPPDPPEWDPSVGASDCPNAWAAGLSPCDTVPDDYVVVNKAARNLARCNQGMLVSNYNIGLGTVPVGDKEQNGDRKTPEGVFYIPRLVPDSQYYKAFLLSYPDAEDAARGLSNGLIDQGEHDAIVNAQTGCTEPPQDTELGGLIEIHGNGGGQDWTWGCIAVENVEIDALWNVLGVGDTIVVVP